MSLPHSLALCLFPSFSSGVCVVIGGAVSWAVWQNGAWPQFNLCCRPACFHLSPAGQREAISCSIRQRWFWNQTTSWHLSGQRQAQNRCSSSRTPAHMERNGSALLIQSLTPALTLLICSTEKCCKASYMTGPNPFDILTLITAVNEVCDSAPCVVISAAQRQHTSPIS